MQFLSNSYLLSARLCPRISSLFIASAHPIHALFFRCPAHLDPAFPLRSQTSQDFSMAYLFRTFPQPFHATLFHYLTMPFRRSLFQFYAYAIGLIAVPLHRFTIPLHCPAIQCRCHPMQFSSVAIPCLSMPMPRFAFLFNSIAFQISANPPPFSAWHFPSCSSPFSAKLFLRIHRYSSQFIATALLFIALLFRCPSIHFCAIPLPSHTTLFPCSSNRFNGIHFLYMAFLFIALPPPI